MTSPKVLRSGAYPTARKVWIGAKAPVGPAGGRLEVAFLRYETDAPSWQSSGLWTDGEYFRYEPAAWDRDPHGGMHAKTQAATAVHSMEFSLRSLGGDQADNAGRKVCLGRPMLGPRYLAWRVVEVAA